MSEYTEQADKFLASFGIKFRAVRGDEGCPLFCDGKHIHGDHYRVTFSAKGRGHVTFSFWNSYNDSHSGNEPTAYAVLACLQKYDPGTFENFCGDFGYDTDSRKAEGIYKAVVKEWQKVSRFFTAEELEQLQEIN